MEKSKLITLAKKFTNQKTFGKTPTDVFEGYMRRDIFIEVFDKIPPESLIILIFLISNGNKDMYDSLYDEIKHNIFSFSTVQVTHDTFSEDCPSCHGGGRVDCSNCDNGKVECEDCGGDGEDLDGNTCDNCEGEGNFECDYCGGSGEEECGRCDGDGTIEDDDYFQADQYFYFSYDPKLRGVLELMEEKSEIEKIDFLENKKTLLINIQDVKVDKDSDDIYQDDTFFVGINLDPYYYRQAKLKIIDSNLDIYETV